MAFFIKGKLNKLLIETLILSCSNWLICFCSEISFWILLYAGRSILNHLFINSYLGFAELECMWCPFLIPPQSLCPRIIKCWTLSSFIAYSIAAEVPWFSPSGEYIGTKFAIFLWIKNSPSSAPKIYVAWILESQQEITIVDGLCPEEASFLSCTSFFKYSLDFHFLYRSIKNFGGREIFLVIKDYYYNLY